MIARQLKPNFGVNYDVGYIGFTARCCDPVAAGITWFERWDEMVKSSVPKVCVTHALVVSGADECVEAHAGTGVTRATLSKYFNDPHCQIFFRKPRGWDIARGQQIAAAAAEHVGDKYGYGIIVADLLANTILGHWLNVIFRNWPNRLVCRLLDRAGSEVCSELAAGALQAQHWMPRLGCLENPACMITPQALFEDDYVFEDWKNQRAAGVSPAESPREMSGRMPDAHL
jgi:hypothetical protein